MNMRELLSKEYIPFGIQYYRAPSPASEDWERDLARIAALGLNTVKYWVQWRWNAPREGLYMFDDIDRLMDLADRNHLRVMLNTVVDVAPAWLYRKFPDVSMVTLDGRIVGPQTQPHRQIGGLGVCFNHAEAMECLFDFLRETVHRYTRHPALEIWNVGSEPELTSSMAELRLYAGDASKIGDMLCYCDNCRQAFVSWLRVKYGSIEKLNVSWNRNYSEFGDIEIPLTRNTFNDVIDWRMFFVHTLGEHVKRRFIIARDEDEGRHPLMCHHVFIQGFPVISTANDPWNIGHLGELHGITQMDDPAMCDVLRSCAKGHPVISAEMLMLFGYTLDLPRPIGLNDIKRFVFTGLAANLKGFIFWQYRPESLGREAPAWGLTHTDGSSSPWLSDYAEVNRVIQRNAAFFLEGEPRPAEVAILYSPQNQIFGWAATGNEMNVTDSLLGMHKALYERNVVIDFLHGADCEEGIPERYRVVIVPFPYLLSEKICSVLEAWVKGGGVLIGESYFGGWNAERGRHHATIPGYGMHTVFGARQSAVEPAHDDGFVGIVPVVDLPPLTKPARVMGGIVKETLSAERAEVLATFDDGRPAVTYSTYGKGTAILIGSYVALPYYRDGHLANADLIVALVKKARPWNYPTVKDGKRVRVDVLQNPRGEHIVIMRNLEGSQVNVWVSIPGLSISESKEEFTGEMLTWTPSDGSVKGEVCLAPGEVKVYRG